MPFATESRHRIDSIDYLRGLLALGVMLYHYQSWSGVSAPAPLESFLMKSGIYAVLSFYIISGISFGYVYGSMTIDRSAMAEFWTKRFFRLAPLYWLAMLGMMGLFVVYTLRGVNPSWPSMAELAANLTLTFGVIDPGLYMVIGGWSIGNEMAYYVMFPVVLLALRHSFRAYLGVLGLSVGCALVFSLYLLDDARTLSEQWTTYINPLSHLYLFVAGVGIAPLLNRFGRLSPGVGYAASALLIACYALLPIGVDQISIVTGIPWVAFSAICVCLCAVVYLTPMQLPPRVHHPLAWLGQASYSVYLLHPLVYRWIVPAFGLAGIESVPVAALFAIPITLAVAHVVYRRLEVPMVEVGRKSAIRLGAIARMTLPVHVRTDGVES